ncbi:hypothetical protein KCP69_21825 [Salmonella enterica subsp. enterica]|nr:hypothetical protein KCP69_21825 [Salmonella enterica subsp. enterica]
MANTAVCCTTVCWTFITSPGRRSCNHPLTTAGICGKLNINSWRRMAASLIQPTALWPDKRSAIRPSA